ncbi:MAG TPA: hypothetical protein VM431_09330 [Phycisphaerae bacterium]|nr:hypothetical protein [Phycisphaerae bacterium]
MEVIVGGLAGLFPCLMFGAIAALVVVGIVYSIIKARERREAMARLAAAMGLTYYPNDPWDLPARYAHLDLFQHGHSKRASNVLAGEMDDRSVVAFDYRYTTGSGKNQTTHHYQAAVLAMPILAPGVRMRPESVLDRVASWVGYDDIDFESDEFSRRYYVTGKDRRFAYDIFHTRLIEYLLGCGTAPSLEMQGPIVLLYDGGREAENLRRLLMVGQEIIRSIPDYVLTARGIGEPPGGQS